MNINEILPKELVSMFLDFVPDKIPSRSVCRLWKSAIGKCCIRKNYTRIPAGNGYLNVLQWARSEGIPWSKKTCEHAAAGGHFELLQWAHANGAEFGRYTCASAAAGGHFELLQWAYTNGAKLTRCTASAAARSGRLDILQWVIGHGWNKV